MSENPYASPAAKLRETERRVGSGFGSHIMVFRAWTALAVLLAAAALAVVYMSIDQGRAIHPAWKAFAFLAGMYALLAAGARFRRQWARRASIVMCILMLFAFPIGTAIGIYLLFNLWDGWPEPREYTSVADAFATDAWRDGDRREPLR